MRDDMNGNTSAKQYIYTDRSGDYRAISVVPNPSTIISSTSSATSTPTASGLTTSATSTPKPTQDSTSSSSHHVDSGVIAGGVIAGVAAVLIVALVFVFWRRTKARTARQAGLNGGAASRSGKEDAAGDVAGS